MIRMRAMEVRPPWAATLTDGQHTLMVYAVTATALALLATLVRLRFATRESQGGYRTASLTANAVVAIAFGSYVLVLGSVIAGYRPTARGWVPNDFAVLAWAFRYVDWTITVPLLVVALLAVSEIASPRRRALARPVGMVLAALMIALGFAGAFIVDDGRSFGALLLLGVLSAVCFIGLYALIVGVTVASLPRLPEAARGPYRSAAVLLLTVWFAYPIVYGVQGITSGGGWATAGAVVLCVADLVSKIGFGSLLHRAAVLRSRADEDASPAADRRPRLPEADSLWVTDHTRLDRDPDLTRD
jgi:bacteriorhodopsin